MEKICLNKVHGKIGMCVVIGLFFLERVWGKFKTSNSYFSNNLSDLDNIFTYMFYIRAYNLFKTKILRG